MEEAIQSLIVKGLVKEIYDPEKKEWSRQLTPKGIKAVLAIYRNKDGI